MKQPWLHERISGEALHRALSTHAGSLEGMVVDVGAGSSPYRSLLGPRARWISVDLNSQRTDIRADAQSLPLSDRSVDGVLCTQVLEHLEEPSAALHEFARVLRAGGVLVLSAPQAWTLHEVPRDFWRFTRFGLERLFAQTGFTIESMTPTTGAIATATQILCSSIGTLNRNQKLVRALNVIGSWLDRRYPDLEHPLDYVVKATRC